MGAELAEAFGNAMGRKDHGGIRALLHPEIDFRGMTPGRVWEADGPDDVIAAIGMWFDESDDIEDVEQVSVDSFADVQRVGYRFRVRNADGAHLVEQQAYLTPRDGRVGWLRIMCSGYRPID